MKRPIIVLFVMPFLCLNPSIKAQLSLDGFLDFGESQVSEGLYSQFSANGVFEKSKWGVKAGCQLGLVQPQDVFFNNWFAGSYGKVNIRNIPLDLGAEYLWTAFSPDLRETDLIIIARTRLTHWKLGFGTSFRTYRLSHKAAENTDQSDPNSRITEKWNMMYHVTYLLKPLDNKWNLSGSLTNYDHFIIQQENNPMFNLRFDYKTSSPLSVYSEMWYKPAGLMVIRVTYYGMFIRLGLSWKI